MPLYEHVFIARQDLSNAQAEGLTEHFGSVLSDNGGKLVDSEYWGVKTMAYKRLMRLHDDVMRVLTIKVDEHEEGPSIQMQKRDDRDRDRRR